MKSATALKIADVPVASEAANDNPDKTVDIYTSLEDGVAGKYLFKVRADDGRTYYIEAEKTMRDDLVPNFTFHVRYEEDGKPKLLGSTSGFSSVSSLSERSPLEGLMGKTGVNLKGEPIEAMPPSMVFEYRLGQSAVSLHAGPRVFSIVGSGGHHSQTVINP